MIFHSDPVPFIRNNQVRMMDYAWVCFLKNPIDENMTCADHINGCGFGVEEGSLVVVDASECELVHGRIWYIAARTVTKEGQKSCKVGYVKCLFNQVHLVAHRVGIVIEIKHGKQYKITDTLNFKDVCQSVAKIKFVDGGMMQHVANI